MPAPTSVTEPPLSAEGPASEAAKVGSVPKAVAEGIAKGNGSVAALTQEVDEEDELEDGEEREEDLDDGPRGNGRCLENTRLHGMLRLMLRLGCSLGRG